MEDLGYCDIFDNIISGIMQDLGYCTTWDNARSGKMEDFSVIWITKTSGQLLVSRLLNYEWDVLHGTQDFLLCYIDSYVHVDASMKI